MRLKQILADAGITCRELARSIDISSSALSNFMNYGYLSSRIDRNAVDLGITHFLQARDVAGATAWQEDEMEPARANAPAPVSPKQDAIPPEEIQMLLRKTTVTPQALRHFNLAGNPFVDPTATEEVFFSPDIRYVREAMYQVARHNGFLAVIGESGAGKSTLREELVDRIHREAPSVTIVEPYVLATEGKDGLGKPLRSQHIAEAVMACVDPLAKTKSSPEARFRQLHESLRQSAKAGHKHVVIIEEAHSLPLTTLKHLKRFLELKDGLRPLLSILLIAQPELLDKLSVQNPEIREVAQRLEIVTLPALGTNLEDYLAQRFKRVGAQLEKVFDRDALAALRVRLTPGRGDSSLTYPLVVHNALAVAMNRAVDLGVPMVTADVIRGV
jgi:type II secretory pathway predicted ATPase ExeA